MTSWRRVHSGIFRDAWFASLPADAKLVYVFAFVTAESGIVDCAVPVAAAMCGLTAKAYDAALAACAQKLVRVRDRVVVNGWIRWQVANESFALGCARDAAREAPDVQAAWIAANGRHYERMGWPGLDELTPGPDEGSSAPAPDPAAVQAVRERTKKAREERQAVEVQARAAFDAWAAVVSPDAQPTRGRIQHFAARVREGMSSEDAAIIARWAVADEFMSGRRTGRPYTDVDNLFRSREKVEKYLRAAAMPPGTTARAGNHGPGRPVEEVHACEVCGEPVSGARVHRLCAPAETARPASSRTNPTPIGDALAAFKAPA